MRACPCRLDQTVARAHSTGLPEHRVPHPRIGTSDRSLCPKPPSGDTGCGSRQQHKHGSMKLRYYKSIVQLYEVYQIMAHGRTYSNVLQAVEMEAEAEHMIKGVA